MSSAEFDSQNSQSLQMPEIVVRDSLGVLAIQIYSAQHDMSDIKKEDYPDLLLDLKDIVLDLQSAYDRTLA